MTILTINGNTYEVDFIEDGHKYIVNGELAPCVSNILSDVLKNNEPIPEYAMPAVKRGVLFHKIIQLDLTCGVSVESIDEQLKGYWDSYNLLKADYKFTPKYIEQVMYNPVENRAMTLDYGGGVDDLRTLLDWKTGGIYPYYKAQLGGYYRGASECFGYVPEALANAQILKNGKKGKMLTFPIKECVTRWDAINRVYDMKREK
jgi:hypothetical protein